MKKTVLVAGYATRHVASSAKRAGYRVCSVDHFCDFDLGWYVDDYAGFEELSDLSPAIDLILSRNRIDHIIFTSGAENFPTNGIPRAGTNPNAISRFLDKQQMQTFFEELSIPHPPLAAEGVYPVMMKPITGAGGWRNAIVRTAEEKAAWKEKFDLPFISQRIIEGQPASVSCISDGKRAVAVAANEQILRGTDEASFGFAGSITPCDHPLAGEMMALAERIVSASGCIGSIGVDFVLADEAVAIEVNPRFQATLDTVEHSLGQNIFSLHMDACSGIVPNSRPTPRRYAARRILFAERDCTIRSNLVRFSSFIADIPTPGTEFLEGDAIVSLFGYGESRDAALKMLDNHISIIHPYLA
ncbi:ATP-grasp domain-containing protein [Methanocalculus sp.]|uniref:ATP-grasp domain-containing protein n=1 Tax=Methanocalculus sp. TaxID=2004547 RepID=UPI00271F1889|nr:ATP-grasp domain-containing protein [Methanocalculus sp.]MDO8842656.1 ATP-grasp domain-containing protein [Methanocalculus sp.]